MSNPVRVWNKREHGVPKDAVYIGRPSIWGNPFTHIKGGKTLAQYVVASRDAAVDKYEEWLLQQPHLLEQLHSLKGKDVVCWCHPQRCHGDVLIKLANQ